jgi:hypothetical protein
MTDNKTMLLILVAGLIIALVLYFLVADARSFVEKLDEIVPNSFLN